LYGIFDDLYHCISVLLSKALLISMPIILNVSWNRLVIASIQRYEKTTSAVPRPRLTSLGDGDRYLSTAIDSEFLRMLSSVIAPP
jgi:hypothetical protein